MGLEIRQATFFGKPCRFAKDVRVEIDPMKCYVPQIGSLLACGCCSFHEVTRNSTRNTQYGKFLCLRAGKEKGQFVARRKKSVPEGANRGHREQTRIQPTAQRILPEATLR